MFEEWSGSDETNWVVPGVDRSAPVALIVSPVVLPSAVLALQAAAEGLRDWHPDELDGATALAATRALLQVEQLVGAARTRSLTDVETRQLHRLDGAPTASRWLRREDFDVPAAQLTLARKLAVLPAIADELAAGRLSVPVARAPQAALTRLLPHLDRADGLIDGQDGEQALSGVIVDGVRDLVCRARGGFPTDDDPVLLLLLERLPDIAAAPLSQLARLEAAFLLLAEHVEAGLVHGCLGELVDALLPVQHQDRVDSGEADRGLQLVRKSDRSGWHVEGDLDLTCGEQLHTALTAELHRDPDSPADTERAAALRAQGLDPHDSDLQLSESARPRSRRQQLHDALGHVLTRYLDADLAGCSGKNPVQLLAHMSVPALESEPGALPARTASGATLPVGLTRRWACGSAVTRFALTLSGRVLEVSHTERTLKAHERRALYAQTGGTCQGSGCRRSAARIGTVLHPHHADPWARCGTTSLTDTVLLCDTDHAHVHHGHVVTLKDGRRLGPDGWVT